MGSTMYLVPARLCTQESYLRCMPLRQHTHSIPPPLEQSPHVAVRSPPEQSPHMEVPSQLPAHLHPQAAAQQEQRNLRQQAQVQAQQAAAQQAPVQLQQVRGAALEVGLLRRWLNKKRGRTHPPCRPLPASCRPFQPPSHIAPHGTLPQVSAQHVQQVQQAQAQASASLAAMAAAAGASTSQAISALPQVCVRVWMRVGGRAGVRAWACV